MHKGISNNYFLWLNTTKGEKGTFLQRLTEHVQQDCRTQDSEKKSSDISEYLKHPSKRMASFQVIPSLHKPGTVVDWKTPDSRPDFLRWKREIKRTMNGPLNDLEDSVKVNHVFLWAGPLAEALLLAKENVEELEAKDVDEALKMLVCWILNLQPPKRR